MPRPIAIAALAFLVPAIAVADTPPPTSPGVTITINPVITVTPPAQPGAPTQAPAQAPAPVEAPPVVDEDPCSSKEHWRHGRWKSRMRGRLSLGIAKSHLELADDREGSQKSLVGRVAFRRGFAVELELARGHIDGAADGAALGMTDGAVGDAKTKTFGGALVKAFGKRKLQPYVLAGGGGGRIEVDGGESRVHYAEFGGGLMLKGRRLGVGVDFRRGVRKIEAADPIEMDAARQTTPPDDQHHDRERYTRGRIMAFVTF